jgi:hypothetical protein
MLLVGGLYDVECSLAPGQPGLGEAVSPRPTAAKPQAFFGSVEINPSTAKIRLVQIAEEIIAVLASAPNTTMRINPEINADLLAGASDQIKRAVSENATALGLKSKTWE